MRKIALFAFVLCMAAASCFAQTTAKVTTTSEDVTVFIPFSNGEMAFWAFTQPKASPKAAAPSNPGEETLLSLKCKNSVDIYVYDADGYTLNTKSGFRVGGTVGDYIMFPVVKGHALKSVTIELGAAGANGKPSIRDVKSGNVVKGGEPWTVNPTEAGEEYTWTLSGTKSKSRYQMYFNYARQMQLRSLTLIYE